MEKETIWQRRIKALAGKGFNQSDIADQVGCTRAAISLLALGDTITPSYKIGVFIAALCVREAIDE